MQYITAEGSITYGGDNRYIEEGSVLLSPEETSHFAFNVLPVYRDYMLGLAREARSTAVALEALPEAQRKEGTINITPTPRACLIMAEQFDRQVNAAQELMAKLQGPGE